MRLYHGGRAGRQRLDLAPAKFVFGRWTMKFVGWLIVLGGAVYALHRLALSMEDRGWIYYRKKRGSSGALGSAFLEMQSLFEPSKRHVLEERRKEDVEDDESGDPPASG